MAAPAQNPPFDFLEAAEFKLQDDRSIGERPDPLRFVPGPLGNQSRRIRIESQPDPMFPRRMRIRQSFRSEFW